MGTGPGHKSALHRAVPGLPNIGIEAPPWAPSPMLALRVSVQLLCFCLGTNIYSEPLGARHCAGCCEHGSVRHARSLPWWSLCFQKEVLALCFLCPGNSLKPLLPMAPLPILCGIAGLYLFLSLYSL